MRQPTTILLELVELQHATGEPLDDRMLEAAGVLAAYSFPRTKDLFAHHFQRRSPQDQTAFLSTNDVSSALTRHAETPLDLAPLEIEPLERDLDVEILRATFLVNHRVGEVRKNFITALPAQDMIYLRKEQEAKDYLAAIALGGGPVDLVGFPLLAAEVGITAEDADDLAQLWLNMSSQWIAVAAMLEGLRLGALRDIANAETPEAVDTLVVGVTQALAGFDPANFA